jgi:hypothetical protein
LLPGQKKRGVSGHNKKPIIIRYFRGIILNYSMIAEFAMQSTTVNRFQKMVKLSYSR